MEPLVGGYLSGLIIISGSRIGLMQNQYVKSEISHCQCPNNPNERISFSLLASIFKLVPHQAVRGILQFSPQMEVSLNILSLDVVN